MTGSPSAILCAAPVTLRRIVRTTTLPRPVDERTRPRLRLFTGLLLSLLLVLVARLWFVQIVDGERYAAMAEEGRVREVALEAPRGRIVDRDGEVLVDNRQVHVVSVRTDEMGARRDAVLADLATVLGMRPAVVAERIAAGVDPVRPTPVAFDVPERTALYVWERQSTRFPGVYAELVPRRDYPHGTLAAHVLGYTAEVSAEQLEQPAFAGYDPGAQVGMSGVERTHQAALHGRPGRRRLQVDATGDVVRQVSERPPAAGDDLRLTLDVGAQRLVEDALATGLRRARRIVDPEGRGDGTFAAPAGAAVVLDPRDGAVVAMASLPTFKPDDFVGGISGGRYANLVDPQRDVPLLNRAIQSAHPPGSVFKIVSSAAALRHGFSTADTTVACPGAWRWGGGGQVFRNWTPVDQGVMTLATALEQSCDTVYYELARRMWLAEERRDDPPDLLADEARRFGYGRPLGIDLPAERAGTVPDRAWRRRYWEANHEASCEQARSATDPTRRAVLRELCSPAGAQWRGGDAVNLAIGQGDLLATPLQVATSFAAVANGGTVWRPRVAAAASPSRLGSLDLRARDLRVLRRGLERVTTGSGTAAGAFARSAVTVAGKTGTAESATQPFAWFAGYAPVDAPRWVVVTMIEEGGSGSGAAAPVARWILDGMADLEPAR